MSPDEGGGDIEQEVTEGITGMKSSGVSRVSRVSRVRGKEGI